MYKIIFTVAKLFKDMTYIFPAVNLQGILLLIIIINNNFCDFKGIRYHVPSSLFF